MSEASSICVIIAAKNAVETIGRAIGSALDQPEVAEVIVVDDGSDDATAAVSRDADDGSRRLRVLSLDRNGGPAAARNHAIDMSHAPLIAILDADDVFLQGRFAPLLSQQDWDLVADNIVFVEEGAARGAGPMQPDVPAFANEPKFLTLRDFVLDNISRRNAPRGETGFLKPVMRRSFLETHGLRYNDTLRLGEDYDLYTRSLAVGARFKVVHCCGYAAMVRANSLSGDHKTEDLRRLAAADRAILAEHRLNQGDKDAIARHERHTRAKFELRQFLDSKARNGLVRAVAAATARPSSLPAIASGIASDKLASIRARIVGDGAPAPRKYLLNARLA